MFLTWATRRRMLHAPSDTAGAGGQGNPGGDGAATPDPGQGGDAQPPGDGEGAGATPPSKPGSMLDFRSKEKPGEGEAGEAWQLPEGLDVPEHLRGASAEDTLEKLVKAYNGAREKIAKGETGEAPKVPDSVDAYVFTQPEDPEDPVYKDLTSEASKPIVDNWREAAKEAGLSTEQFDKFLRTGMSKMFEQGLAVASPQEQADINAEQEWQALVKEVGQQGANTIAHQMTTYGQQLEKRGIIQDDADATEWLQMVGTARGARLMSRILSVEFGEKAIPPADAVDGAPTQEEAYAAHREAMSLPKGSDRDEAIQRAEEMLKKALNQNSTPGQIRSRVL
jgi:hypothetical protein